MKCWDSLKVGTRGTAEWRNVYVNMTAHCTRTRGTFRLLGSERSAALYKARNGSEYRGTSVKGRGTSPERFINTAERLYKARNGSEYRGTPVKGRGTSPERFINTAERL